MNMARNNKNTNNESTDSTRAPKPGTRICTHADIVHMNIWISSNALQNTVIGTKRLFHLGEPSAKKGDSVTNIKAHKLRYIGPGKSASAANVLRPNFGAHREPNETNASFNYEKFVADFAALCCRKEQASEKENDGECSKEIVTELLDQKDE